MKLRFFTIIAALLCSLHAYPSQQQPPVPMRNIVILLEQGRNEGVDKSNEAFLSLLSAALEEKQICLVSTSLWRAFLEKRFEIEHLGAIKGTDAYKFVQYLSAVKEEITRLSHVLRDLDNADEQHYRNVIVAAINQQFFDINALEEYKHQLPSPSSKQAMQKLFKFYLTAFHVEEWEIYAVNKHFRLLVPKKHTVMNTTVTTQASAEYTPREKQLGLKIDHLRQDPHGYDVTHLLFDEYEREDGLFIQTLHDVFVSYANDNSDSKWNIVFGGHGYNGYTKKDQANATIANLRVDEFKQFLQFLEHTIKTNALFYITCYGGGQHLVTPYTTNGIPDTYSYTIISTGLADNVSIIQYAKVPHILCNNRNCKTEPLLKIEDIRWKSGKDQYGLKADHYYKYKKFYKMISDFRVLSDSTKLLSSVEWINSDSLLNIVWVRFSGKARFVMLCPKNVLKIDTAAILVHQAYNKNISCAGQRMLAIDTPYISMPLVINDARNNGNQLHLDSVRPGNSVHLFEEIKAPLYRPADFAALFWPPEGLNFTKLFLIKRLIIAHDQSSPLAVIFNTTENTITLHNVIISVNSDTLMRIIFEISDQEKWCAYVRYVDNDMINICAIEPLNQEAVERYQDQWKALEQSVMDEVNKAQPLYASLQEALTKDKASSTV